MEAGKLSGRFGPGWSAKGSGIPGLNPRVYIPLQFNHNFASFQNENSPITNPYYYQNESYKPLILDYYIIALPNFKTFLRPCVVVDESNNH